MDNIPPAAESGADTVPRGFISATSHAPAYQSTHSQLHASRLPLLSHVNCCYLSNPRKPPTLEALKQHAQSLAVLIAQLSVANSSAEIDNARSKPDAANAGDAGVDPAPGPPAFDPTDAFDYLNDLRTPYATPDVYHKRELWSLLNLAKSGPDSALPHVPAYKGADHHRAPYTPPPGEVDFRCPLETMGGGYHDPDAPQPAWRHRRRLPFAAHSSLAAHANTCLEMLDNDYAGEGGLLAMLPTDAPYDAPDLVCARSTLLGQWLAFTQALVARARTLEVEYAGALDVLAGEAVVPLQTVLNISHSAADAADAQARAQQAAAGLFLPPGVNAGAGSAVPAGAPPAPQANFVLANCGEDVLRRLHELLDTAEAQHVAELDAAVEQGAATRGVAWQNSARSPAEIKPRAVVYIDVGTRYYRLRADAPADAGQGADAPKNRTPIFVVPGRALHPSVAYTRDVLEKKPGVMVLAADWRDHASSLQLLSQVEDERDAGQAEVDKLKGDAERRDEEKKKAEKDLADAQKKVKDLEAERDALKAAAAAAAGGGGVAADVSQRGRPTARRSGIGSGRNRGGGRGQPPKAPAAAPAPANPGGPAIALHDQHWNPPPPA